MQQLHLRLRLNGGSCSPGTPSSLPLQPSSKPSSKATVCNIESSPWQPTGCHTAMGLRLHGVGIPEKGLGAAPPCAPDPHPNWWEGPPRPSRLGPRPPARPLPFSRHSEEERGDGFYGGPPTLRGRMVAGPAPPVHSRRGAQAGARARAGRAAQGREPGRERAGPARGVSPTFGGGAWRWGVSGRGRARPEAARARD